MNRRRLLLVAIPSAITLAGLGYVQWAPQDPPPPTGYAVVQDSNDSTSHCHPVDSRDGAGVCLTELRIVPDRPSQSRDGSPEEVRIYDE